MQVLPIRTRVLRAPQDSLSEVLETAKLNLKEGDILAVSSKVVSIDEGNTVSVGSIEKRSLVKQEAEYYKEFPNNVHRTIFTLNKGSLAGSSGIDESNGNGYYILYPKDPFKSAKRLRTLLRKKYGLKKLGVIITDSMSIPLRRGSVGFALSWAGFAGLKDYRKTKDLFGRFFKMEVANVVDGLAASAVVVMGEGSEGTPLAVIRGAEVGFGIQEKEPLIVAPEDDMYAPLLFKNWKRGG